MATKYAIIAINYCFKVKMILTNLKFTYSFVVMFFMKIVWIGKNIFNWVYALDALIKKLMFFGMLFINKKINLTN